MGQREHATKPLLARPLLALVMGLVCHSAIALAQEQPRYGGTMILATLADPGSLNPGLTTSVPTHIVTGPIFNGLVGHDFTFAPVPDLAERWSVSPDGRVYTFHLVQHALWHDGQPVTSAILPIPFSNAAGYQNPRVDELFDLAARTLDRPTRARAYFEIQEILARESPYIWLVEAGHLSGVAFRTEFRGLHSWSSKSIMTYGDDAWWSKGKPREQ